MHCHQHIAFHANCSDCRKRRREAEAHLARSAGADSLLDDITVTAAADSIINPPSMDTAISDSTGFCADTNSGGDFGGGGAGGDW